MELKTFVTQSLIQIVEGVVESADRIAELGGSVSPAFATSQGSVIGHSKDGNATPVHAVKFDVALTVGSSTSNQSSETLSVAKLAVTEAGEVSGGQEEVSSRLQFTVPLQLPTDPRSKAASDERAARRAAAAVDRSNTRGSGWRDY